MSEYTGECDEKKILVLVTSVTEHNTGGAFIQGKWFHLNEFVDRDAFMIAAQEYVTENFPKCGRVCLRDYYATFDAGELIGFDYVKPEAWEAMK